MVLIVLFALLFSSCGKRDDSNSVLRQAQTVTIPLEQSDAEIARIAENARNTLHLFLRQLTRGEAGESNFSIKYPFTVEGNNSITSEQVWLTGIHFRNGVYYGILSSTPHYLRMQRGDTVIFDTDEITDWMYIRNGKIIGGLSIKYLLEKIPEHERSSEHREILQMFD